MRTLDAFSAPSGYQSRHESQGLFEIAAQLGSEIDAGLLGRLGPISLDEGVRCSLVRCGRFENPGHADASPQYRLEHVEVVPIKGDVGSRREDRADVDLSKAIAKSVQQIMAQRHRRVV